MLYTLSMSAPTALTVVRRTRPLALTSVLPQTVAVTPDTYGRRSSARASSSVSGRTEVGMPRNSESTTGKFVAGDARLAAGS